MRALLAFAAVLLAAVVAPFPASAHHEPSTLRYVVGNYLDFPGGVAYCTSTVVPDGPDLGGACRLTPPTYPWTIINVTEDFRGGWGFAWQGERDDLTDCGQKGTGRSQVLVQLDHGRGCTHIGVFVKAGAIAGTITLEPASEPSPPGS